MKIQGLFIKLLN